MSDVDTALSGQAAEEILGLLGKRRINKSELARRLGVSHTWVTNRLTGDQEIGLNELQKIAVILGVDASDLLPRKPGVSTPIRTRSVEARTVATIGQDRPIRSIVRSGRQTRRSHRPGRAVSATRPLVPLDRPLAALSAR